MNRLNSSVKNRARVLLLIALAAAQCPVVSGQHFVPLHPEDLLDARQFGAFSPMQFSPNGTWIVYTVQDNRKTNTEDPSEYARTGVPSFAKGLDVFIVNTENHENRSLTAGKAANWAPAWSPDGRYLAFLSDRDNSGQAKVWLWETTTGKFRKVSDLPVRAEKLEWMPDSRQVLTTILPQGLNPDDYANRVLQPASTTAEQGAIAKKSTVVVYDANGGRRPNPVAAADPWSLESYLRDIALMDIQNSAVVRLAEGKRVSSYVASPDGSYVAFSSPGHFETPGSQQILWNLSVVAVSTRRVTTVAADVRFEYDGASFSWSPDSLHLAYSTGGPLAMDSATGDCYVVDMEGDPPQNVTKFPPQHLPYRLLYKQRPPLWNSNGRFIYFIRGDSIWVTNLDAGQARKLLTIPDHRIIQFVVQATNRLWSSDGGNSTIVITDDVERHQSGFYEVGLLSGHFSKLLENDQCYICVNTENRTSVNPNGKGIAYLSQDSQHYDDLWLADVGFSNPRRLTDLNPQLDEHRMGAARLVEWRSLDGEVLHGALLLPPGHQEGKRYPLIVWVYGGATGSDSVNHFGLAYGAVFNLQLLATRGYAVLFPDAPQHVGTPMIDLAKTVLPGVDKVIEMGIADADRLGVVGHSYGGYSTLSLMVLTKRFKVAVIVDGTGDLIAQYGQMTKDGAAFGTSIAEKGQGLMGGTPWEFRDRYIENSPIFFLDRVDTPLLIVHGGGDSAVAPFLGDEVFVGLRRLGKEVEYAKYEGEGHSPVYWSYENQVDFCNRMIAWIDGHLRDRNLEKSSFKPVYPSDYNFASQETSRSKWKGVRLP